MDQQMSRAWRSWRAWAVLALVVAAFFLEDSFDSALYHPIALAFGVHRTAPNTLGRASYGIEMLVRLLWFSGLWTAVCATLGRSARNFPLRDSDGNTINAKRRLVAQLTIKDGRVWYERPSE